MGSNVSKQKTYVGHGSTPENACKNIEAIIINSNNTADKTDNADDKKKPKKKYSSVIVTLGPEDLTPIIKSPRANVVDRLALATIDGKEYNVTITKNDSTQAVITSLQYVATIKV